MNIARNSDSQPDANAVRALLGGQVGHISFAAPRLVRTSTVNQTTLEYLEFAGSHGETVPADFLPPKTDNAPAILYCHAHGGRYDIGTNELTDGRPALAGPYLHDLNALGCAVLCLEMPCFGTRQSDESALSKAHLWQGTTLFGQMLAELTAGLDYLSAHQQIDASRIASLGISMGGTHSWWLAALDDRLAAAVSLCCFSDLDCLIANGSHDMHGQYMTVPGLLSHTTTGKLAGLAAPTPMFIGVGLQDWSSPKKCFEIAKKELVEAYGAIGMGDHLEFCVEPDAGHQESEEMRTQVIGFLKRTLAA